MSQLSHMIRRFNRFEIKYQISLQQAEAFKHAIQAYLTPDENGESSGRYSLASLYYDSPDFRCYWEKIDGIKFRRKLRLRRYETGEPLTPDTPIFVEIKQRVDRVTQKRRALLPYAQALSLCTDRQMPDHASEDRVFLEEVLAFAWQYNLQPASIVRYERQAFIGSQYDLGLRVTFDSALTHQQSPLTLHTPPASLPLLPADQVVMEIKVNERIPYWLTELLAAHNLHTVRISKYAQSITTAQNFSTIQSRAALSL